MSQELNCSRESLRSSSLLTPLFPNSAMTTLKKKKKTLRFSFSCGCRDSKSVAVSEKHQNPNPDTDFSSILTSSWEDKIDSSLSGQTSPNFSGLLRQLNDLEKSVLTLESQIPSAEIPVKKGHARSRSEGGRVQESVAVVKDSDDPLTDFRRSMLQMIVEKEIVGPEELRELVRKFLSLNSPQHHEVILRAFAEIWSQVFSKYQNTPEYLVNLRN